jgi:predicted ArsR family transcriptional regulator
VERTQTVREAIREELLRGPATARELSERISIREKDVAEHLEHLEKSLRARGDGWSSSPQAASRAGSRSRRGRG